jgi:UPF0755 protein
MAVLVAAVMQRAASPGPSPAETVVVIERGAGVGAIAEVLEDAGVVAEPWLFRLYARLVGAERALTAGEYAIPARASAAEVVRMLRDHEVVQYRFTLVEGWTVAQTFEALAAAEHLTGELPEPPPEGRLLPDTYFFQRGETRAEVVRRMRAAMEVELAAAWEARAPDLPLDSAEEALTLASIVEKETGVASERELVAGVFVTDRQSRPRLDSRRGEPGRDRLSLLRRRRVGRARLRPHPRRAQRQRPRVAPRPARARRRLSGAVAPPQLLETSVDGSSRRCRWTTK